jgi:hypothetical protein
MYFVGFNLRCSKEMRGNMPRCEKRSLLWEPRRDWEDNIKRDFKEMRNNGVDWRYLASDWI